MQVLHTLDEHKNLTRETHDREELEVDNRSLMGLLGRKKKVRRFEYISEDMMKTMRKQANLCKEIFHIFRASVLIMDEVDMM
jgi:hypothetical protein